MAQPKIVVTMCIGSDVIWRVSKEMKPASMVRLGLEEYEAVAEAAELELMEQIKKSKSLEKSNVKTGKSNQKT
jgi:hypothetical protein